MTQFNQDRVESFKQAATREWEREIAADPDSFRTLSGTIATGAGIADRMFGAIARKGDCGAVCFLQSKAIGRAARSLGIKFTIKACNAWLSEPTEARSEVASV